MTRLLALADRLFLVTTLAGLLAFAASLTPSLIPRAPLVQGVLSGASVAAGVWIAKACVALWRYMELPERRAPDALRLAVLGLAFLASAYLLIRASGWQDALRALFGLEPAEAHHPVIIAAVALAVFVLLLLLGRGVGLLLRRFSAGFARLVPRRVAMILGGVTGIFLIWTLSNGLLLRGALSVLDGVYSELDLRIEDGVTRPQDPLKTGSPASAIAWGSLGRAGREMVAAGPGREEIAALTGRPALEPIRVYVGLNSAETVEARADLALAELIRTGAFERSLLVINTPTGTGWIDPEGQPALEYLHGGDVATVSVQYSYLASWLALLTEYEVGEDTGRAVFDRVYGHWTALPKDARPRLFLHGLSLGSYYSDLSSDLFKVIGDPHDGAFWVGPPYSSRTAQAVTAARNAGSPAWLPRFRDGSLIRFTGQENVLDQGFAGWGAMRIVYLQYASDPVTFFDAKAWFRPPAWMATPRGPDVSPLLRWFPVVTQLQLGIDMAMATTTPLGHGHVYAAAHYIDGWVAVTQPEGWSDADIARLKAHLARR